MDIVSPEVRSRMMSGIRGKNTKPELVIRRMLHRMGFRYRLHDKRLSGTPDLVLRKYRAAIFVHGCFWHGHDCNLFKWPSTRREFWKEKITRNRERDADAVERLCSNGWRVLEIWECALKGRNRKPADVVVKETADWITGNNQTGTIDGTTSAID